MVVVVPAVAKVVVLVKVWVVQLAFAPPAKALPRQM